MKTILVMTDFSIGADHAAHYALKLAQQIKANLLLCNVFLGDIYNKSGAEVGLPIGDFATFEKESVADLSNLAARLNRRLVADAAEPDSYRPRIRHCCMKGPIGDAINELAVSNHVLMAVISMHNDAGLSSFLLDNHTTQIIEAANCPVLVVPYPVAYNGLKRIAFATDLSEHGLEVLRCLTGLAKHTSAEILITHVDDQRSKNYDDERTIKQFFNQASSKTNYPEIYFKAIKSSSVTNGLDWLTEHTDIDMLVVIHQKRNILQRIFERSVTKKLAGHLVKPMLVFPSVEVLEALPVF